MRQLGLETAGREASIVEQRDNRNEVYKKDLPSRMRLCFHCIHGCIHFFKQRMSRLQALAGQVHICLMRRDGSTKLWRLPSDVRSSHMYTWA